MGIPEKRYFSLDLVASRHTLIICTCGSYNNFLKVFLEVFLDSLSFVGFLFESYNLKYPVEALELSFKEDSSRH